MAFRFKRKEEILEGVQRIAGEQIDKAIEEIEDASLAREECIHQVRKRCKKLRGLLRLIRPGLEKTYQRENAWFRDTARSLSVLRDAKTMQDTYDALMEHYADQVNRRAFSSIRRRLTEERKELVGEKVDPEQRLDTARRRFSKARKRIDSWQLSGCEKKALQQGLEKTYGRARKAMFKAQDKPSPERFHEWRKRAKYHWYHTRILRPIWPAQIQTQRDASHQLTDWLGDDHDLTVLSQHISENCTAFGDEKDVSAFVSLGRRRRRELQMQAFATGILLFAEEKEHFSHRWIAYWSAWHGASS